MQYFTICHMRRKDIKVVIPTIIKSRVISFGRAIRHNGAV